jgi:sec-independent protein translocase protein TatA
MIFKRLALPVRYRWGEQGAGHVPLPGAGKKPYRMLSIPDMAILGAAALMFFGPEQLPKVARKVGIFMRDVQNTSQEFVREMERAADEHPDPLPSGHDYYASGYGSTNGSSNGSTVTDPADTQAPVPAHEGTELPRPPRDYELPP